MKPDWSQYRGSKFKQLVQKQILSTRVEKIRKQNAESLSDAKEALQKEFDGKKQDAKEKLVRLESLHGTSNSSICPYTPPCRKRN